MRTEVDIAWAAGFLEGEGSFEHARRPAMDTRVKHGTLRVSVEQTQLGPLEKLQSLFGGKIYGPYVRKPRYIGGANIQPLWIYRITGESARELVLDIFPYLFEKRKEKILSILDAVPSKIRMGVVPEAEREFHPSIPVGAEKKP